VSERAQPSHPFKCKLPDGTVIGGSYDNISAVTIAAALYSTAQAYSADFSGGHQVVVYDENDVPIAAIGKSPDPPTQTLPVGPAPVLSALQPDSAGDWSVEVHAVGQNFTSESQAWSSGVSAPTTFISDTELSFVVPGVVAAGTYDVTIKTGELESNALPFTAL